jgi:hypothetical protein
MSDRLQKKVVDHCKELGPEKAAEFFGVGIGLVRQWINGSKSPSLAAAEKVFADHDFAPTAQAEWDGKEVFLALPFYKETNPRTLFSILGVWDREKYRASVRWDAAFIAHTRNQLAADFLSTGVPHSWWIDDDMVFPMGNAGWFNRFSGMSIPDKFAGLHTPSRLRSHGKSVVSAVYVGRDPNGRGMYAEAIARGTAGDEENKWAHGAPYDTIKETKFAGFGCIMISRQVFLDIQSKFPHLAPESGDETFHFFSNASDALLSSVPEIRQKIEAAAAEVRGGTGDVALRLLDDAVKQIGSAEAKSKEESRLQQGEDRTFCLRAREAGHPTFVDFAVVCGHVGRNVFNVQNTKS